MALSKNDPSSLSYNAKLLVAPSKTFVGSVLHNPIVQSCQSALQSRDAFTIALSGGSLPSFLQALPHSFQQAGVDPQWEKWHVLLADERCVVSTDADSNLGAILSNFVNAVPIPKSQVYGIDEALLSKSTDAVAAAYEQKVVRPLLEKCGGMIDCVVLGFGPDGHTCSLFPSHPLLTEETRFVAPIDDSPKPPLSRITLTFPVLNKLSRKIIFCGAGSSKRPILKAVFGNAIEVMGEPIEQIVVGAKAFEVEMTDPAPYPCGMVRTEQGGDSLVWVVDADAAEEAIMVKN
mmetsp:Transcript_22980/g.41256  ORF Transcript_22980/g.41256 Transcript_22980/m.41256 type:complete len:290 (-) Transcript_22980:138-1007(-)